MIVVGLVSLAAIAGFLVFFTWIAYGLCEDWWISHLQRKERREHYERFVAETGWDPFWREYGRKRPHQL